MENNTQPFEITPEKKMDNEGNLLNVKHKLSRDTKKKTRPFLIVEIKKVKPLTSRY